jgi:hypothetical protein
MRPEEIDRVVGELDRTRRAEHFRNPDRPDGRTFKPHGRVPPEVVRAQTRIRTAHWRTRLDRDRRPTAQQIGMSLVAALVTTPYLDDLTKADRNLVGRMLLDLQARGFSIAEAKRTLRRIRNRELDPADREGEATEAP